MLRLEAVDAGYGPVRVLRSVSFDVAAGEVHCLLGRNGAGKTTALRAIMGLLPLASGRIRFGGAEIGRLPPHRVPRLGIGYVPQGRRLFAELTVAQNLEIGRMARGAPARAVAAALDLFPRLADRLGQRAGTLSGGEQQMLAMARALCLEPRLLLLDEPTEGLQPSMIRAIRDAVAELKARGVGVLLVEQRIDAVLALADRATFLENGRCLGTLTAAELQAAPDLLRQRLGV
ncbi:MAG: ABC transporter ATP-binding protein [Rhodobacteraceae bacterium]|nr:ABC transporter ATP-binding protein [Paracoccaceae bacterium]